MAEWPLDAGSYNWTGAFDTACRWTKKNMNLLLDPKVRVVLPRTGTTRGAIVPECPVEMNFYKQTESTSRNTLSSVDTDDEDNEIGCRWECEKPNYYFKPDPNRFNRRLNCSPCPEGRRASSDWMTCVPKCPEGQYHNGSATNVGNCTTPDAGHYVDLEDPVISSGSSTENSNTRPFSSIRQFGAVQQTPCASFVSSTNTAGGVHLASGSFGPQYYAKSSDSPRTTCEQCPLGYVANAAKTACLPCFGNNRLDPVSQQCVPCAASEEVSSVEGFASCRSCQLGQFVKKVTAEEDPIRKRREIQAEQRNSVDAVKDFRYLICQPCPAGRFSNAMNFTGVTECEQCKPGMRIWLLDTM